MCVLCPQVWLVCGDLYPDEDERQMICDVIQREHGNPKPRAGKVNTWDDVTPYTHPVSGELVPRSNGTN